MAVLISGKLIGPNGDPRPGVTIMLTAVKTSSAVVHLAPSSSTTGVDGSYSLSVEVGTHNVMIEAYARPFEKVGQITVYSDSKPGTLNDFLTSPGQDELTPAIVAMVDDMRTAAALYAQQALTSRDEAKAAAEVAQNISDADTYYITPEDPDGTIAGLAGTSEGKSFRVAQGVGADSSFIYYRKTNGQAIAIADSPSKAITDLIKKSAGKPFMRWRDKLGMVAASWSADTEGGVGFVSKLVKFSRNGFFSENTEVSDNVIRNKDFSVVKSEDGSFKVRDRLGLTLLKAKAGSLYLPKISAILNSATNLRYGNVKISIGTGGDIIALRDSRGVVGLRVDNNCVLHAKIAGYDGSLPARKMTEDSIISLIQSFADSAKSNFGRRVFNNVPALGNPNKSKKKVQFWIVYGQSFGVGAQSGVALSTAQTLGNVMLGGSPRGTSFGNLATEYTYSPVGGENIFYPLVEVLQSNLGEIVSNTNGGYGETIASSFANNLKAYHNQSMGVDNDEDFIIGVACCGVSGRTIEQLKKGATPEIYNRVETCLDGIAEAAAAAGYDWEIGGVIYSQSENDNSQSFEFYYPRLQSMHDTLIESCMVKSGQDRKPLFMLNQLGNSYVRGMGVPAAQIELALKNDNVVLVGSYQGLSNPGAHLSANSYRILGAMFARDAFRHMSGYGSYPFKCEKGVYQDNSIYLGMTPHVTPVKFSKVFNGWNYIEHADKGITVNDASGVLSSADLTVTVVSPTVIKVLCNRTLSGKVFVTIGDSAHNGTHNISDSGSEVAYNKWVYGVSNQYPQENVSELVNKNYSLATFSAIQTIQCNEV